MLYQQQRLLGLEEEEITPRAVGPAAESRSDCSREIWEGKPINEFVRS